MARRRVLITGGAGYIGSHAAIFLSEHKDLVSVLDNLSAGTRESVRAAERISAKNIDFYEVDLLDADETLRTLRAIQPDIVLHLAASKSVAESMNDPEGFHRNNVQTTRNLVQAMAESGVRQVIFASTASVYGEPGDERPVDENSPLAPHSPYAQTKVACEEVLNAFGDRHHASVIHLRFFNVCGAHPTGLLGETTDPPTNLVPILMAQCTQAAPEVTVYGTDWPTPDGSCIRDYVHVQDVVRGMKAAMDYAPRIVGHEVFNLGTERGSSVLDVVSAVQEATGRTIKVNAGPRRPGDPGRYIADSSKAHRVLGWQPEWHLADMTRHAWSWQRQRSDS